MPHRHWLFICSSNSLYGLLATLLPVTAAQTPAATVVTSAVHGISVYDIYRDGAAAPVEALSENGLIARLTAVASLRSAADRSTVRPGLVEATVFARTQLDDPPFMAAPSQSLTVIAFKLHRKSITIFLWSRTKPTRPAPIPGCAGHITQRGDLCSGIDICWIADRRALPLFFRPGDPRLRVRTL